MAQINKGVVYIIIPLTAIVLAGCWFYSFTDKPYPDIENTFVEAFDNETDRYDLAPALTEGLINKLHGGALLKITGRDNAQSIISGTVTSHVLEAYSYTAEEEPLEFIVKIEARVKFTKVASGKELWQATLEGFATYPADESTKDEETAREEAIALLVERILDRLREG
ncbi:hypothetical protein DRQ36_10405 [bacterium]|nr:MAG: hypothetical protein DRQ36_10405 [bacterium]